MKDLWKECGYLEEIYDLRHTWGSIKCRPEGILLKPESCVGCPLLIECTPEELEREVNG